MLTNDKSGAILEMLQGTPCGLLFHAWEKSMKPNDRNLQMTKAAVWVLAALCVGLCFAGPTLSGYLCERPAHFFDGDLRFRTILITGYLLAADAFACLRSLYVLLLRIGRGEVFVRENVTGLSHIAIEVLLAALGSLFLGITCTLLMLAVSVMAFFMVLIVNVVRSAFAKAVLMKDELDLTV